ncbi:MAG: type II toxin-antitoxin system HicB family antitoxin [Lachnospiraceae bacterium]
MKGYLKYKDYIGSVEYSETDDCLYGKVMGIRGLISYEGNSVAELKKDFYQAIDEYLDKCKSENKEPEVAFKGSFNVRIDPELHRTIAIQAKEMGMSLNAFIKEALIKAVR